LEILGGSSIPGDLPSMDPLRLPQLQKGEGFSRFPDNLLSAVDGAEGVGLLSCCRHSALRRMGAKLD